MIQCLKQKAKERPDKRRVNKVNEPQPPHLEQPGQRSIWSYSSAHNIFILAP